MITAYTMTAAKGNRQGIGIVYKKDGNELVCNSFSRADKEHLGDDSAAIYAVTAVINDCKKIAQVTGDTDVTLATLNENVLSLDTGELLNHCELSEKLLEYVIASSETLDISFVKAYDKMQKEMEKALSLAQNALKA